MEPQDLKVLMISSDRKILEAGSAVSERMKEYGKLVGELHIVVLSDASHGLKETTLGQNVWAYPTNSAVHFLRPLGARALGKKIVVEKQFVRGRSVISADSLECGWAALGIKNHFRLPLEVQLHTDPFSPYFNGFQNMVRKLFAQQVLASADSIRVVSEAVGKEIARKFPNKSNDIVTLPIFVDRERIDKGRAMFDLRTRFGWSSVLLSVARLTPEKNLSMALDVLARLRQYAREAGLVIVGSGPEELALKAKAKALGIGSAVAFVGWQEDLASYYHSATLLLQTSRFEGYGLSVVEAGLSGLPVVTTPVGIANDLENGKDLYVCPQDDVEYMFKAVYDLVENPQKRSELSINLKRALETKLISKEAYLAKLQETWQAVSLRVHS